MSSIKFSSIFVFVDNDCKGAGPGEGGGDSGSETEIEEEVDGEGGGEGAGGGEGEGGGEGRVCDFENTVAYQVTDPLTSGDEDDTEGAAGPFEGYDNEPTLAYNLHEEDGKDSDTQQESKQQQNNKQTRSVKYDQTVPYSLTEEQSDGYSVDKTAPQGSSNAGTPAISGDQTDDYTVDTDTEGEEVGSEVRSKYDQTRTGKLFEGGHTGLKFLL